MDRRPRWMLSTALAALLGATLLVGFAPSSAGAADGSPAASPTGLIAALADRLVASSGLRGPMALVDRLVAAPRLPDPAPVASGSRAKLPADLITLERKMRGLHINSERGSIVAFVSGESLGGLFEITRSKRSRRGHGHAHKHGRRRRRGRVPDDRRRGPHRTPTVGLSHAAHTFPLFTADFESSVSPRLAIVRGRFLGAIPFQMRVIGEETYMRSPFAAKLDGGKPWVSESATERAEERAKVNGESSATPQLSGPESPEPDLRKLIGELNAARSVVKVGKAMVDGRPTTEFEAKLDPRRVLGKALAGASPRTRKRLRRAKITLDVYLASNGLPVRTSLDTRFGKVGIAFVLDIRATEIPVTVQPPPASETITKSELEKLQEQEARSAPRPPSPAQIRRQAARTRRFIGCVRRRLGKHPGRASHRRQSKAARECERIVKRGAK